MYIEILHYEICIDYRLLHYKARTYHTKAGELYKTKN